VLIAMPPAVAALALLDPAPAWQLALLAPLVALLGVPHGALDHRLATAFWPLERPAAHVAFLAVYTALAAAVLGLWMLAPGAALAMFLLYSGLHFADDWRGELPPAARTLAGLSVVAGPAVLHEAEVAAIFAHLAPEPAAGQVAAALSVAGWGLLPLLAAVAGRAGRWRPRLALELAVIALAGLVLSPLVYFVLYFCGVHSPRHFLTASGALGLGPAGGAAAALPITALTLAGAGMGTVALVASGLSAQTVTLTAVFVGLAALAVPHMLIVDRMLHGRGNPARAG
jgi:Brp/Blh family beta-carotene 15,15'-monooxygenase